jgi:hypothetical protein
MIFNSPACIEGAVMIFNSPAWTSAVMIFNSPAWTFLNRS